MDADLYSCELPHDDQYYIMRTLNETEMTRRYGFKELKEWAEQNPNLNVRVEDKFLLPFMRVSKFDSEKAKQKLAYFYTMRRDRKEWFSNRDPTLPQIQALAQMGSILILQETSNKMMVMIIRPTFHDPDIYNLDDVIKTVLMVLDIAVMEQELAQIYGIITVIDMVNLESNRLGHLKQLTLSRIKNLVKAWHNYHCRPQRIEFVNAPSYINVVLNIFKTFMSTKMKQRTHVCHDTSSLVTFIDKKVLPNEYGGLGDSLAVLEKHWSEKLIAYADWFKDDEKYKANEEVTKSWFHNLR